MTHLFYFSAIFFIWRAMLWIFAPNEKTKAAKEFDKLSKLHKGVKWDDTSEEYRSLVKTKVFPGVLTLLWLFVGLFTSQWLAFLLLLTFNFVVISPLSTLTRYSFTYTAIQWANALIGVFFGFFVIINKYHLHIDLWAIIKPLLA